VIVVEPELEDPVEALPDEEALPEDVDPEEPVPAVVLPDDPDADEELPLDEEPLEDDPPRELPLDDDPLAAELEPAELDPLEPEPAEPEADELDPDEPLGAGEMTGLPPEPEPLEPAGAVGRTAPTVSPAAPSCEIQAADAAFSVAVVIGPARSTFP
jgi:hypothetical protein